MKRLLAKLSYILTAILFFTLSATAQSPYRTSVTGDVPLIRSISNELSDGKLRSATPFRASRGIRLSFWAQGLGKMNIELDTISYKSWDAFFEGPIGEQLDPKDVILVAGFIKTHDGLEPIGGSIYRSQGRSKLHLVINGFKNMERSAYVEVDLDHKGSILPASVSSLPRVSAQSAVCGTDVEHIISNPLAELSDATLTGIASGGARISTDADPEYYAAFGADTNAHIATLISSASSIYRNQLGITLTVASQHVYISPSLNPYTSTYAGDLLAQFQNNLRSSGILGSATAFHLFTGKDLVGSTIGVAYVGTICVAPDYSTGLSQKFHPSSDASLFAHELGHNLGANHDNSDRQSLMAPFISIPGSNYFSTLSISEMQTHLTSNNTCLDQPISAYNHTPIMYLLLLR